MQHTGEELLQIDALGEAVGSDQHPLLRALHRPDALLAQLIGIFAGHDLQVELGELFGEERPELLAEVVGRRDVATEDDRVEASAEPRIEQRHEIRELGVVLCTLKRLQAAGELAQLPTLVLLPVAMLDQLRG